jgi:hypothetical protein
VDEVHGVGHVRLDPWGQLPDVQVADLVDVGRELVVHLGERLALLPQRQLELLPEDLRVVHVLHP